AHVFFLLDAAPGPRPAAGLTATCHQQQSRRRANLDRRRPPPLPSRWAPPSPPQPLGRRRQAQPNKETLPIPNRARPDGSGVTCTSKLAKPLPGAPPPTSPPWKFSIVTVIV